MSRRKKVWVILVLLVVLVASFLLLNYFGLPPWTGPKFEVVDNQTYYNVEPNRLFRANRLDGDILEIFNKYNVKTVKINFIENPRPKSVTSEYGADSQPVEYAGFNVNQDGEALLIDLYIDYSGAKKLGKDNDELLADSLTQMFVAIKDFEHVKLLNGKRTKEEYSQTLNERYRAAADKTNRMISDHNAPFTISQIQVSD